MAVTFDDVQKLKDKLAHDLEVVRQFEELLQRHGINGNGNGHKSSASTLSLSTPTLPGVETSSEPTVKKGINTGLADKIVALVHASAAGLGVSEMADSLIAAGYPHSTRNNLKVGIYQAMKKPLKMGKIKKNGEGKFVKP